MRSARMIGSAFAVPDRSSFGPCTTSETRSTADGRPRTLACSKDQSPASGAAAPGSVTVIGPVTSAITRSGW